MVVSFFFLRSGVMPDWRHWTRIMLTSAERAVRGGDTRRSG